MIPTISQVCTLASTFADDVADYSAAACHCMELWLTKLEQHLEQHSLAETKQLLSDHGMAVPAAAWQGGLLASQGDARREHWEHFARRLELLKQLGVEVLVVACDVRGNVDHTVLDRVLVSLEQAASACGEQGVKLALEFQAGSSLGNNLQTAASMVSQVGNPHLGICLDTFHWHCGPSKTEDLALLTPLNLFHVQLSDLLDVPREFASDSDRILPGEGQVELEPLLRQLQMLGYQGKVSLELGNPRLWQVSPKQFAEIAMTSLRRLLGQASMG